MSCFHEPSSASFAWTGAAVTSPRTSTPNVNAAADLTAVIVASASSELGGAGAGPDPAPGIVRYWINDGLLAFVHGDVLHGLSLSVGAGGGVRAVNGESG